MREISGNPAALHECWLVCPHRQLDVLQLAACKQVAAVTAFERVEQEAV